MVFMKSYFDHVYPFVQEEDIPIRLFAEINCDNSSSGCINTFQLDSDIVQINCSTQLMNSGVKYRLEIDDIKTKNESFSCRFGLAFKIDKKAVRIIDGTCPFSYLLHYSHTWIPTYVHQYNLELPLVKIHSHEKEYIMSTPPKYPVQFHQYNDGNDRYISVSTLSKHTHILEIIIDPGNNNNMYDYYYELFPDCDHKDKWRVKLNKLQYKYGLDIVYVKGDCYSENFDEVSEYILVLDEEINKYPQNFFRKININTIVLYSNKPNKNKILGGQVSGSKLYLNVHPNLSNIDDMYRNLMIHHEVWHCIDIYDDTNYINDTFTIKYSHILSDICLRHEYYAHLYAHIMVDHIFVDRIKSLDKSVHYHYNRIIKIMYDHNINIPHATISYPIMKTPHADISFMVIRDFRSPEILKKEENKEWILYGLKGTGLSIVKELFSRTNTCIQIIEVDPDNFNGNIQSPSLLLTRNPVDYSIYHFIKYNIPIGLSISNWCKVYNVLIKHTRWYLRHEDLLTKNINNINAALLLMGTKIKLQDLYFIDSDRIFPYCRSEFPLVRNYWEKIRNSEVCQFLYPDFTCED